MGSRYRWWGGYLWKLFFSFSFHFLRLRGIHKLYAWIELMKENVSHKSRRMFFNEGNYFTKINKIYSFQKDFWQWKNISRIKKNKFKWRNFPYRILRIIWDFQQVFLLSFLTLWKIISKKINLNIFEI